MAANDKKYYLGVKMNMDMIKPIDRVCNNWLERIGYHFNMFFVENRRFPEEWREIIEGLHDV